MPSAFLFPLHVHSSLSKPAWLAQFLYINGNTSPPALLLLAVDLHSKVIWIPCSAVTLPAASWGSSSLVGRQVASWGHLHPIRSSNWNEETAVMESRQQGHHCSFGSLWWTRRWPKWSPSWWTRRWPRCSLSLGLHLGSAGSWDGRWWGHSGERMLLLSLMCPQSWGHGQGWGPQHTFWGWFSPFAPSHLHASLALRAR